MNLLLVVIEVTETQGQESTPPAAGLDEAPQDEGVEQDVVAGGRHDFPHLPQPRFAQGFSSAPESFWLWDQQRRVLAYELVVDSEAEESSGCGDEMLFGAVPSAVATTHDRFLASLRRKYLQLAGLDGMQRAIAEVFDEVLPVPPVGPTRCR